jgi:membrane AbrB-like protein
LLPHIIILALLAVILSTIFSVIMARYSGIDAKTAFFAVIPGGLSEMGTIGANIGARSEPIVLCQTLRVVFVVCLVPPLYGAFLDIDTAQAVERAALPIFIAIMLVIAGATTSYLLSFLRLNMPWTIGALVGVGFLTVILAIDGGMPDLLFRAAQILIGYAIGSKVDVFFLLKMPRITLVGAVLILVNMAATAALALLLPVLSPLDYPSAILATSPGGMAEMITTAHTFYLDVAAVTAFQAGRTLMVNAFSVQYWWFFNRIGLIGSLNRLLNRSS